MLRKSLYGEAIKEYGAKNIMGEERRINKKCLQDPVEFSFGFCNPDVSTMLWSS